MREATPDTKPDDFNTMVDGANFECTKRETVWEVRFDRRGRDGEVHKLMFDRSHFLDSFQKVHALWPSVLRIDRYEEIREVGGYLFPALIEAHKRIEESGETNIIDHVVEWTIFQNLHRLARENLSAQGVDLDLSALRASDIENQFLTNFEGSLNGDV